MQGFSKKDAISFGWEQAKRNWKFFLLIGAAYLLIQLLPGIPAMLSGQSHSAVGTLLTLILSIIGWVLKILMGLGFLKISLAIIDKKSFQFSDLFNNYQYFWRSLAASAVYGLAIFVGIILLIVPGIIFAIRLQYFNLLIIDKGMGPIEALKKSWEMTRRNTINLLLLGILCGLINILGALALGVGLVLAFPTTLVASTYVYRKLLK